MALRFEWNKAKAVVNQRRHGISFREATTVFADPNVLFEYDDEHSEDEDRFHAIGVSERTRLLLVVHCDRGEVTRIISARRATQAEVQRYEQQA